MRYYGESNVPGAPGNFPKAPGNLFAGGNFMGGQGLQINPESHKTQNRQQKIYNKGMGTDNPNEREIFLKRTGPQLPMAMGLDSNPLVAQAYPGPQAIGNTAAFGGMMGYDSLIQYLRDTNNFPPVPGGGTNMGV